MLAFVIRSGNVFDDKGDVAGSCYCIFLDKTDKRQSSLHIDGTSTGGSSS